MPDYENNPKNKNKFSALPNVEKMHDMLVPEEFPEGAFGSPINKHEKVESKSTEWEKGQQRMSAYVYADKEFHDDKPRQSPDAHPLHDE